MSAIRTPRHSTKKRIVVNLKTGQTVNVALRWAVVIGYSGCNYSKHYYKKGAEQSLAIWEKRMVNSGYDCWIEEQKYNHILDDEGCVYNNWVEVPDGTDPHTYMKEWNDLLAQLP